MDLASRSNVARPRAGLFDVLCALLEEHGQAVQKTAGIGHTKMDSCLPMPPRRMWSRRAAFTTGQSSVPPGKERNISNGGIKSDGCSSGLKGSANSS